MLFTGFRRFDWFFSTLSKASTDSQWSNIGKCAAPSRPVELQPVLQLLPADTNFEPKPLQSRTDLRWLKFVQTVSVQILKSICKISKRQNPSSCDQTQLTLPFWLLKICMILFCCIMHTSWYIFTQPQPSPCYRKNGPISQHLVNNNGKDTFLTCRLASKIRYMTAQSV